MNVVRQPIVILIADDDDEDQMLTRETFEDRRLANELRYVKNGEEVMQYLRRQGKFAATGPDPAGSQHAQEGRAGVSGGDQSRARVLRHPRVRSDHVAR